jgi:NADH-quinone oxidoreductase subunit G
VRVEGKWREVDWQHALEVAASGLHAVLAKQGGSRVGALASPNSTLEEFYLLQKIMRAVGSPHIDHRLRETDMRDQAAIAASAYPGFGLPIAELENCDAIILIGSNIRKEQPIAALRLRKAARKGAVICAINPVDYEFNFTVQHKVIAAPQHLPAKLKELVECSKNNGHSPLRGNDSARESGGDVFSAMSAALTGKQKVAVILGASAMQHHAAAELRYYANQLALSLNGTLSLMTEGANAAGAWLAGAVPTHNAGGLNAAAMLEAKLDAYVLLNVEPEFDCANAQQAVAAMEQAKYIVALSTYKNPVLEKFANVILPVAAFTETAGTFVSAEGRWQHFNGMAKPAGEARPAWKVLRVLANFIQIDGFDYESVDAVRDELRTLALPAFKPYSFAALTAAPHQGDLVRIGETPIYSGCALVRRAVPLQQAQEAMEGDVDCVRLHPATASRYQLADGGSVRIRQGEAGVELPVKFDKRISEGAVWVAAARTVSAGLGGLYAKIEIEKA